MAQAKKWKWGILGTGKIAQDFATALQYLPDAEIIAVGSRNKESANKFGERFQITPERRYESYELLAKDKDVDIIYVSTLHPFHYEATLLCLDNNKNVIVEKPMSMNAIQAEEMIKKAKEKGLLLMEAMWTRYLPAMFKLREIIASGTIGDVQVVQGNFGFIDSGIPRLDEPELGGGALLDIGVYPIAFASMLCGGTKGIKPDRIQSIANISKLGVDTQTCIQLGYSNGQMASLFVTLHAETSKEWCVFGTKGWIRLHKPAWCTEQLTLYENDKEPVSLQFPLPTTKEGHTWNFINSVGLQYEAAYAQKLLSEGKTESDIQPLAESLLIMEIMDEVRKQVGVKYALPVGN